MKTFTPLWLFLVFLLLYVSTANGLLQYGDDVSMLQVTRAVVDRSTVSVPAKTPGSALGLDGRRYGKYGLGQSLLAIPFYLSGNLLAKLSSQNDSQHDPNDNPSPVVLLAVLSLGAVSTAAAVALVYLVCIYLNLGLWPSLAAAFALGAGTFAWHYARTFMSEPTSMLAILLTYYGLLRFKGGGTRGWLLLSGAAAGLSFLLRTSNLVALLPLGCYLLFQLRQRKFALQEAILDCTIWGGPIVTSLYVAAIYNFARFGSVFETGYGAEAFAFTTPMQIGLLGLTLSSGKSIFLYAPITLAGLVGWARIRRLHRAPALTAIAIVIAIVLFYSRWHSWFGGGAWGPRLLAPALPFLVIGVAGLFQRTVRPIGAVAITCLALASLAIQVVSVLVPYVPYEAKMESSPALFQRLLWDPASSPILAEAASLLNREYPLDLAPVYYQSAPLGLLQLAAFLAALLLGGAGFLLLWRSDVRRAGTSTSWMDPTVTVAGRLIRQSDSALRSPESRVYIALFLIAFIGLIVRVWDIGSWPVFIDEDVYVLEASELVRLPFLAAIHSAPWGKAPLPFLAQGNIGLLTGDFLIASRVLAGCAGAISVVLCFLLGRRLSGSIAGLSASLLYALSPVAILHERMALLDGPMSMLSLASVLLGWQAIERRSWRWAASACLLGALAAQWKAPAVATSVILGVVLLTYYKTLLGRVKYGLAVIAAPCLSYLVLMLSPLGGSLGNQNADLFRPPTLGLLQANLAVLQDCVNAYLPGGIWVFMLTGVVIPRRYRYRVLILVAAILTWSLPWLLFSRFAPSRYYLPALPYAYVLAGITVTSLAMLAARIRQYGSAIAVAVGGLALVIPASAGLAMVCRHESVALSNIDQWQYRSGWPSGYGYSEAASFISGLAKPGSAVAYAIDPRHRVGAGFLKAMPAGVESIGLHATGSPIPQRQGTLYVVVDDGETKPGQRVSEVMEHDVQLSLVAYFPKPGSESAVYVLAK